MGQAGHEGALTVCREVDATVDGEEVVALSLAAVACGHEAGRDLDGICRVFLHLVGVLSFHWCWACFLKMIGTSLASRAYSIGGTANL